jgi:tetratricopeptide (TPR) repeat protein
METSFSQLVAQVLQASDQPLSLDEIMEQVEQVRLVRSRNPRGTIGGAIHSNALAVTLGGRPARYTWWPRHLADNAFRQTLVASDLKSGTLVMNKEVWLALWPGFFGGSSRGTGDVTLALSGGPDISVCIEHLVAGQAVWGLPATPALADWYRIAQRNLELADAAESVLRAARDSLPSGYLIPRLIGRDAYRNPHPPDALYAVLRADLRFLVGRHGVDLVPKMVDWLEKDSETPTGPGTWPRPPGPRKADTEEAQVAWGNYLFDRGMECLWAGWDVAAEAYYREALRLDPEHADAYVHMANRLVDQDRVAEALPLYERGEAAALERIIGDPASYPGMFWGDVDSRPFMRALHGKGLCLWRLSRADEARNVFAWMMELNPNDNQGVRFLLHDMDEGLSWEESMDRDKESF